jgi:hypothetical protein
MTLAEFRKTVTIVRPQVAHKKDGYQCIDEAEFCRVYACQLKIEQLLPNAPGDSNRYYLILEKEEYLTTDLERLEGLLYEYGLLTGLNETPKPTAKYEFRYRCPRCGSYDLQVQVEATAHLDQFDSGDIDTTIDPDAGHTWTENSVMICRCGFDGISEVFDTQHENYGKQ